MIGLFVYLLIGALVGGIVCKLASYEDDMSDEDLIFIFILIVFFWPIGLMGLIGSGIVSLIKRDKTR